MFKFYVTKVQISLQRILSASETETARKFFEAGYSINYAIEYFK